jgi:hypothetical protein
MVWQVNLDEDLQVIVLSFSGLVTGPELVEAAAARIQLGQEHGIDKYIIDAAEMIAPKSTIMDVLDIPKEVYFEKEMQRTSLIAVVRPGNPASAWIAEFYENASILRGWRVRTFDDSQAAQQWLQNYGERAEFS